MSRTSSRKSLLNVQLKLPSTGFKSLDRPEVVVDLGRNFKGAFYKSVGLNRSIKAKTLSSQPNTAQVTGLPECSTPTRRGWKFNQGRGPRRYGSL